MNPHQSITMTQDTWITQNYSRHMIGIPVFGRLVWAPWPWLILHDIELIKNPQTLVSIPKMEYRCLPPSSVTKHGLKLHLRSCSERYRIKTGLFFGPTSWPLHTLFLLPRNVLSLLLAMANTYSFKNQLKCSL